VDDTMGVSVTETLDDEAAGVGEGYPGEELAAGADGAAQAEFDGGGEFGQCATIGREYDANAEVDDTNAGVGGGARGGFPAATDVGQKAGALGGEGGILGEHFVAAVAVDA